MGILSETILHSRKRVPLPILTFPAAQLVQCTVRDIATNSSKQAEAQVALHRRYQTPVVMSAMDLSVEAEEFGSRVQFGNDEVPTVVGRLVTETDPPDSLAVPQVGSKRTRVYLETVQHLAGLPDRPIVAGSMIGPLSLVGRLFGVSEALLATSTEPELIIALLERVIPYQINYARAFKKSGAHAVLIAEPTAGLLSPRSVSIFSSPYIRRIIEAVEDDSFEVVLHNCGARIGHLQSIREAGAHLYHFGKPMDLPAALAAVPASTIIGGNLDPAEVFHHSTAENTASRTAALLEATRLYPNFFPSSGCDIPAPTSFANLDAFFSTVSSHTP
jgi:uroporphyrinogen decarboxylase